MAIVEVILIALFWIFVVDDVNSPTDALLSQRYPAFQDINVMLLIGFGFLMTFIRSYAWSALAYTFLINAFIAQFYVLFNAFWKRVLHGGWKGQEINIDIVTLITCSYAVASVLITFGGVIGRVGPRDLLLIGFFHIIGYTLNE